MGVAVRKNIDILLIIITFPQSTCISSFFGSSDPMSGFLCFVRVSVVTRSRGILFILGIILIVISLPRPNAFSITFVILIACSWI